MEPGRHEGCILLADIFGYSGFLNDVRSAHQSDAFAGSQVPVAYSMMPSFLEGIAARIVPPFAFLKFEGDAVFAIAPDGAAPTGQGMIEFVTDCFADFTHMQSDAEEYWTCTRDACSRKKLLDLKFIVHFGEFFIHDVGGRVEALGPEINVAHRLLKNDAVAVVGSSGYGLFTDATIEHMALPLGEAAYLDQTADGQSVGAAVIPLPG